MSMEIFYKTVFAVYIAMLAIAVFVPRPDFHRAAINVVEFHVTSSGEKVFHKVLYDAGFFKYFANLIMLMPLAILIPRIRPNVSKQVLLLTGCVMSVLIEFFQIYIPGRVSDVRDIVLNTLGLLIILTFINSKAENRNQIVHRMT